MENVETHEEKNNMRRRRRYNAIKYRYWNQNDNKIYPMIPTIITLPQRRFKFI